MNIFLTRVASLPQNTLRRPSAGDDWFPDRGGLLNLLCGLKVRWTPREYVISIWSVDVGAANFSEVVLR